MLFLLQLRGELQKMAFRQRTFIGFGVFPAMEALITYILHRDKPQRDIRDLLEKSGYDFSDYFSHLTLATMIVSLTVVLLASLFLALVLGDIVAKESEDGSLRLVLSRPISRLRLLAAKYCAGGIYTFGLMFFIFATSLLAGAVTRGWHGGLFFYAWAEGIFGLFTEKEGLIRYMMACPLLALSMFTVSSLAFMFSCFRIKPAAAAILTLSITLVDYILHLIPFFKAYQDYFLTAKMTAWSRVFQEDIPWASITASYSLLLGIDASCFVVGWLAFQVRDFKS